MYIYQCTYLESSLNNAGVFIKKKVAPGFFSVDDAKDIMRSYAPVNHRDLLSNGMLAVERVPAIDVERRKDRVLVIADGITYQTVLIDVRTETACGHRLYMLRMPPYLAYRTSVMEVLNNAVNAYVKQYNLTECSWTNFFENTPQEILEKFGIERIPRAIGDVDLAIELYDTENLVTTHDILLTIKDACGNLTNTYVATVPDTLTSCNEVIKYFSDIAKTYAEYTDATCETQPTTRLTAFLDTIPPHFLEQYNAKLYQITATKHFNMSCEQTLD